MRSVQTLPSQTLRGANSGRSRLVPGKHLHAFSEDGQIRLGNFDCVPARLLQGYGRIKDKELTHLRIGQVAEGFADVQDGILKVFGPHHRFAIAPLQILELVDVVTNRERFDIVVGQQDAADARSRK